MNNAIKTEFVARGSFDGRTSSETVLGVEVSESLNAYQKLPRGSHIQQIEVRRVYNNNYWVVMNITEPFLTNDQSFFNNLDEILLNVLRRENIKYEQNI